MLTDGQEAELKLKYGRVITYEVDGRDVVFRKPSRAEYMRFVDELADDRHKRSTTLYALVRACCVLPAESAPQESLFEDYPGLIVQAGADLQTLAGAGAGIVKKGG